MDVADGSVQDIFRAIADLQRTPRRNGEWVVKLGAFLTIVSFIAQVVEQISSQGGVVVGGDLVSQFCVAFLGNRTDGG